MPQFSQKTKDKKAYTTDLPFNDLGNTQLKQAAEDLYKYSHVCDSASTKLAGFGGEGQEDLNREMSAYTQPSTPLPYAERIHLQFSNRGKRGHRPAKSACTSWYWPQQGRGDFSNRHQLQGKTNDQLKVPLHPPCTHGVLKHIGKSKIIMFYTFSSTQQLLQMAIHFKPHQRPFIWVNSSL